MSYLTSPLRPSSRPSSRSSNGRSASPSVSLPDNPVAIRNQMSTLKHTIRHQQAQLQSLENTILRGPRPLPPGIMNSPPHSPTDFDQTFASGSTYMSPRVQKRNSFEVLHGLAGPESSLPLPRREERSRSFGEENGIREGIPTSSWTRQQSPTRTLSRIPVSSVGNARALAEEGQQDSSHLSSSPLSPNHGASSTPHGPTISPSRRSSFAPGNTTKVLADLQAGVMNAKTALENTKAQLRVSQRQVSQLTRQTEDLKEVRERLRLENEGLNNVVARKERLLQEVLERARKAEAEVIAVKTQVKSETSTSKKSLREMETALTEATARSQKAEREYVVLRDSIKGLVSSFQTDTDGLRNEMRKREEKILQEAEEMGKRYTRLIEEVRREREDGNSVVGEAKRLREENERIRKEVEESFREDIGHLRSEVDRQGKESEQAWQTARNLAEELARLRRLMRTDPQATDLPVPESSVPS
ncbi:uncharacterized protein B0H18DRAFT_873249 [Fomitopsis serialis]|uniref:uncharacterized protein n=1 Tax=Fomitopsis serialis TaxID=139415 RepID=UPI002007C896|nr:uncharacterized protein B0H18DRAFT_893287 [Neoantrodia serialis]XP_047896035.1 uncharacterized protein B0H18DRAFT_873249 [Neoantrodia serialis]KAH9911289.1 hypothetical protein B0H18DRAFT_893287 [Neoantrodia serialis]KAH9930367.1 hypothetical protein B0H18DRAFT_873249 [Neoantrodia serialis]